jgi:hypothetical protein
VGCGTSYVAHGDLVDKHEGGSVLELWKEIEGHHVQKDASLRHEAWSLLFALRKRPDDTYVDYFRRDEERASKTASTASLHPHDSHSLSKVLRYRD